MITLLLKILILLFFLLFLSKYYPTPVLYITLISLFVLFSTIFYLYHINTCNKKYDWGILKQSYSPSSGLPSTPAPVVFLNSFSYSTFPTYGEYSTKIISKYCSLHNYTHILKNHNTDPHPLSPYWDRVRDLISLSKEYPENTIFVYLDIDATINPKYFKYTIPDLLRTIDKISGTPSDIYIGYDPPPQLESSTFNTGVMIVRNTIWSRDFLTTWYNTYDPSMWSNHNGKWVCTNYSKNSNAPCKWAGIGYEQGEFNLLYKQNKNEEQSHITGLHYTVVSNMEINTDSFILHLMSSSNKHREAIFKKFLNKL